MNLNGMVSMWKVRELVDKATNIVMNYTETEAKVRCGWFLALLGLYFTFIANWLGHLKV